MMIYEKRIESSLTKTMNELKKYQIMRQVEQQYVEQQFEPSPSFRDVAATQNSPAEKIGDLKKQSQYAAAHVGANSLEKGDYDNKPAHGAEENKPNQSQLQTHAGLKADRSVHRSGKIQG
jgi:hypothetical protein